MGPVAAVIGAVASVGGTIASVGAQRKATRLQQQQQEATYRRQQRAAIREGQIRRSQGMATAQAMGVTGGSVTGGGVASIGSQTGSTLGFATQMSGLSSQIGMAQSRASTFGAIASIGGDVFQMAQGPDRLRAMIGQ